MNGMGRIMDPNITSYVTTLIGRDWSENIFNQLEKLGLNCCYSVKLVNIAT